jgi:hypothetical protein
MPHDTKAHVVDRQSEGSESIVIKVQWSFELPSGWVGGHAVKRALIPTARTVYVHRPIMSRHQALTEKAEACDDAARTCGENGETEMMNMWLRYFHALMAEARALTGAEATKEVRK